MRLFVALDIDAGIRDRIATFMDGVRNFAPDARFVEPASLHVTLKFIGEQSDDEVANIRQSLATIAARTAEIVFRGYGFFPTPKSARVFWVGMESGPELSALAATIDERMFELGIPKENRAFSPHLTLARAGGPSGSPRRGRDDHPNRVFKLVQDRLATLPAPEFGTMTPREFCLYQSQLSPKGSKYTQLAKYALQPQNG